MHAATMVASARELLREGHDVTVVEQSGGVGGQWPYEPRTDAGDPLGAAGVHSSVYASSPRGRSPASPALIDCLCEDGRVVFADATGIVADAVVYCTGYKYSFPFLDTAGVVAVDDNNRVGPLFEHTFPPALAPTLSFVGLPRKVPVPWFYEVQARWVAQVLSGSRSLLPSPEEMMRSVEEYNDRGWDMAGVTKKHLSHDIFDWEVYCDDFAEKELLSSSLASLRDRTESFHHDSDLVREACALPRLAYPDAMS
ncbi:unnamed protein product [Urochloa decumbens]|uniref:Flavin-containing monooxygenase n=1 Tax=Urochloa decumbens TaxID=240449 RepID=A0ABC9DA52_9POAL